MPARPLIIDTDPGVDDAVALVLALRSPEVDVRAVVAAFGNVGPERTLDNAGRILALAGREDVPLGAGAEQPLVHRRALRAGHVHGDDGLGGRAAHLPEPVAPHPGSGIALMARVLEETREPVTIASIGPLTDTALLLAAHPGLAERIERIVVMGGAIGGGNITGAAEFNVHADPEAAHRVLTQDRVPVALVPLETTLGCAAGPEWIAALTGAGPVCAELAAMIAPYYGYYRDRYGRDAVALHDAIALLECVAPGSLAATPIPLGVDTGFGPARGATVPYRAPDATTPPVDVLSAPDVPAVLDAVLARLAGQASPCSIA
ncbi:nucleoside hydrolase [Pseudonocardia parietis]|uniref:Pyrimidine-specific ribonucleoside hydrolase n=1 Tax=Pseudonocardia parietis TaxID=570936 RepID=A0ABS4VQS7_9PSEU|nr:nucleoside hydrolase [Pseudonocardia parietis]MBP2366265.1 pyrimidine-specific ribonucleoside hydrolase [Pseudonocardia parietis]